MKRKVIAALPLMVASPAFACSPCRALVSAGIFDGGFAQQLLVMVSPVAIIVGIALLLVRASGARHED